VKVGLSTYSLKQIQTGEMDVLEAIQWIADNGGEHVEITPSGYNLIERPELIERIVQKAQEVGLPISHYSISANFVNPANGDIEQEIERTQRHIDIAHQLGVKTMRHDVASRPKEACTERQFEADFKKMVYAVQQVADYAATFGITTTVENHGYFIQSSSRVERLIHGVDRSNFKATLDIGNFLCVDEDPVASVKQMLPYAAIIHLKDFYMRKSYRNPGEGWFKTLSGNYLRGAILGHGDIDITGVIRVIKCSGYSGYLSIEFEGMEESKSASKIGMDNANRFWEEA
jgi:sugar phosphate isomerase/epimerase